MIEQLRLFINPAPALLTRLEALGLSLTYDPIEHHGYRAEWRLDGCGAPSWSSLSALEEWLGKREEAREEAA